MAKLDLNATPNQQNLDDLDGIDVIDQSPATSKASKTALRIDDWSLRQGEQLHAERYDQMPDATTEAVADFRAAAYEPNPTLVDNCEDSTRLEFMQTLLETPDWQSLRQHTMFDSDASDLAALHVCQEFYGASNPDTDDAQQEPSQPDDGKGNEPSNAPNMQALRAAAQAAKAATKEVESFHDMQRAFGLDPGSNQRSLNAGSMVNRFHKIRNSAKLRKIIELAGRYRRLAQSRQRKLSMHGQDEVIGVETGNDLERLTPQEMMLLIDEEMELYALKKYTERQMLQRAYRGNEAVARGPVVICVDESGSMTNRLSDGAEIIEHAKAMALALAWVAKSQGRFVALHSFTASATGQTLVLNPDNWNEDQIMQWINQFLCGGGTQLESSLGYVPSQWDTIGAPHGKTDMIMITDGICDLPSTLRESYLEFKAKEQCKLFTLLLAAESNYYNSETDITAIPIHAVSDELHIISDFDLADERIGRAFDLQTESGK